MGRVFIVESPTVNVTPAESWGEISVLYPEGVPVSPLDTDIYNGYVIEALEKEEFNPKDDMIVLVGPLISMSIVTAALTARFKVVKGLLYNANKNEYVLRILGRWKYVTKWKKDEKE